MSTTVQAMLILLAKVTVLLGVAGLVDVVAMRRHASASARHVLWTLAVVAALLVPFLGQVLPSVQAPILGPAIPQSATAQPTSVATERSQPMVLSRSGIQASSPATPPNVAKREPGIETARPAGRAIVSPRLPLVLYVTGVLIVLAGIVVDHTIVWRIARKARPVSDQDWLVLLETLAHRTGVRASVALLRSETSLMPMTVGVVRPRIVIPRVADSWSPAMRETVLLHELAHIARRDCLTQTVAAVACAVYWINPLMWYASARLRVEREVACDDRVLSRGVPAHDYAGHLLGAARDLSAPRFAVSMAAARGLERRLRGIIDDTRPRAVPRRSTVVIAAIAAAVSAAATAVVRPSHADAAVVSASAVPAFAPVTVMAHVAQGGRFTIRVANPDDGAANAGRIHFMLETPGLNTFYAPLSDIEGLTPSQLAVAGLPLRFKLRRDAGTFDFTGIVRTGYGNGQFDFMPNPAFADSLAARGIQPLSPDQQFSLARHGVGLAYVRELATQGYATPSPRQLVNAGTSGADAEYVRDMAALGYREPTVDAIIRLSNQGVDPDFIRGLAAHGYSQLSARELIALRNQSVDTTFIRQANSREGRRLSISELVRYRIAGAATPAPAAAPTAPASGAAPANATAAREPALAFDDTVVTGRWKIVPTAGGMQLDIEWANVNQWRRLLSQGDIAVIKHNASRPSSSTVRFQQDAGTFEFVGDFDGVRGSGQFTFTPNMDFRATLRSIGVRDVDEVGIHTLKNLAFGSISASAVREFSALGFSPLTVHDLRDFAIWQITPSFVREMKARGLKDADSVDGVVDLKRVGARRRAERD